MPNINNLQDASILRLNCSLVLETLSKRFKVSFCDMLVQPLLKQAAWKSIRLGTRKRSRLLAIDASYLLIYWLQGVYSLHSALCTALAR